MSVGIDIVKIDRIEKALLNDNFIKKILSDKEITETKENILHIAASFAAKEAFSKAIGTGIRGFGFTDISVLHDTLGKPYFEFSDRVNEILNKKGITKAELSITHEKEYAMAVVIVKYDKMFEQYKKAISVFEDNMEQNIITPSLITKSITKRKKDIHKGDCGRLFILAGSKGLTGAAIMCSRAALKSGAGLISLGCAKSLNNIFEIATPEVMTIPLSDNDGIITNKDINKIIQKANESDCVLIGPGLSVTKDTCNVVYEIIRNCTKPLIIDADGINAIAKNIDILKDKKSDIVITPHIGEFARLVNKDSKQILGDTLKFASEFAKEHQITVVLKCHKTVVAEKSGKTYTNILGNPGMATGGSGDVLCGIIASFTAQKLNIEKAAYTGVYIHSLAADMMAQDIGEYGLTPSDITDSIPYAIKYSINNGM